MSHTGPALAALVCLGTIDKAAETERPVSPALSVRNARSMIPVPVAGWEWHVCALSAASPVSLKMSAHTTDGSHPTMI